MTDKPRVRIVNDSGIGYKTKVYIDDVDVSECFSDVQVSMGVKGVVEAQLNAICCEVKANNICSSRLEFPFDREGGTRDLLVKYGWTPPAEPVELPIEVRANQYEPLDEELFNEAGVPTTGRQFVDRFLSRVQSSWEPGEHDSLTVARVYDEAGEPVPGKREYTLTVTMDATSES